MDVQLQNSAIVKDLGSYVSSNLIWRAIVEERLMSANKMLCLLRRNVSMGVKMWTELIFYKFLFLPIILYGFVCKKASRVELKQLESLKKKPVKYFTVTIDVRFKNQLRLLNVLPLPMFRQRNISLFLTKKTMNKNSKCIDQPETLQKKGRKK